MTDRSIILVFESGGEQLIVRKRVAGWKAMMTSISDIINRFEEIGYDFEKLQGVGPGDDESEFLESIIEGSPARPNEPKE